MSPKGQRASLLDEEELKAQLTRQITSKLNAQFEQKIREEVTRAEAVKQAQIRIKQGKILDLEGQVKERERTISSLKFKLGQLQSTSEPSPLPENSAGQRRSTQNSYIKASIDSSTQDKPLKPTLAEMELGLHSPYVINESDDRVQTQELNASEREKLGDLA